MQPSLLNKVIDDKDVNRTDVIKRFGFKNGLPAVNLLDLAPSFEETVAPYSFLDGGSLITDLALLKTLVKSRKECIYLEIGTWRGESVANVASVAKHCYTLNLSAAEMLNMDLPKAYTEQHAMYSKSLSNVTHLEGNSLRFDFSALQQKFDVIFIDGDHHYESVLSDTRNAFKLLRNEHSVIVWHDAGNSPEDTRWDVLKGILDGTPSGKRQHLRRVSNTLCAIYTTQPLPSYTIDYPSFPDKKFEVHIKAKK